MQIINLFLNSRAIHFFLRTFCAGSFPVFRLGMHKVLIAVRGLLWSVGGEDKIKNIALSFQEETGTLVCWKRMKERKILCQKPLTQIIKYELT